MGSVSRFGGVGLKVNGLGVFGSKRKAYDPAEGLGFA